MLKYTQTDTRGWMHGLNVLFDRFPIRSPYYEVICSIFWANDHFLFVLHRSFIQWSANVKPDFNAKWPWPLVLLNPTNVTKHSNRATCIALYILPYDHRFGNGCGLLKRSLRYLTWSLKRMKHNHVERRVFQYHAHFCVYAYSQTCISRGLCRDVCERTDRHVIQSVMKVREKCVSYIAKNKNII